MPRPEPATSSLTLHLGKRWAIVGTIGLLNWTCITPGPRTRAGPIGNLPNRLSITKQLQQHTATVPSSVDRVTCADLNMIFAFKDSSQESRTPCTSWHNRLPFSISNVSWFVSHVWLNALNSPSIVRSCLRVPSPDDSPVPGLGACGDGGCRPNNSKRWPDIDET